MEAKYTSQLKAGDIVKAHGGLFRIVKDAKESQAHRPMAGHLKEAYGPSSCAWAESVCIEGEFPGYFKHGSPWTFQGNYLARKWNLVAQ